MDLNMYYVTNLMRRLFIFFVSVCFLIGHGRQYPNDWRRILLFHIASLFELFSHFVLDFGRFGNIIHNLGDDFECCDLGYLGA